jgi:hypothetical protein
MGNTKIDGMARLAQIYQSIITDNAQQFSPTDKPSLRRTLHMSPAASTRRRWAVFVKSTRTKRRSGTLSRRGMR